MEIVKKGRKIELYDSIKDMPARRLMQFQLHLTQHHGMGSTFEELDAREERIGMFLAAGRVADAYREWENRRLGFWAMMQGINTATVALACLVRSVDGEAVEVRTDEQMRRVALVLEETDISQAEVEEILETVKKKVETEQRRYAPRVYSDNSEIGHIGNVVKEAALSAELALGNEGVREEWEETRKLVLDALAPMNFDAEDPKSHQAEAERAFASLCTMLSRNGVHNPAELPALDFDININLIKEQHERSKTNNGKAQAWNGRLANEGA